MKVTFFLSIPINFQHFTSLMSCLFFQPATLEIWIFILIKISYSISIFLFFIKQAFLTSSSCFYLYQMKLTVMFVPIFLTLVLDLSLKQKTKKKDISKTKKDILGVERAQKSCYFTHVIFKGCHL